MCNNPGVKSIKSKAKKVIFKLVANERNLKRKLDFAMRNQHLVILNFHKISPPDQSSWKPLDPIIFRELLSYIQVNFEISTFQDLEKVKASISHRPRIILSFDDGYKDFIEYAMPILFESKIRVNQNIIPNCSMKGMPPLNVVAQDWIGQAPLKLIENLDIPNFKPFDKIEDRYILGSAISQFLKFRPFVQQQEYYNYLLPQFLSYDKFNWTKMMSIDDIKSTIPFHEIGLHSMNHESMSQETDEYFRQDLLNCQNFAKRELNILCPIYAFPNGAYRPSQIEILSSSKFSHILLVGDEVSNTDTDVHNRFNFFADSISEAKFKATGSSLLSARGYSS